MQTAVVLFTRDLRVHDLPALAAADDEAERVVPLFVLDDGIVSHRGSNGRRGLDYNRPNRAAFLADSLADLDASLRDRGAGLVVRRGDVVGETLRLTREVGAGAVHCSADVSRYAERREARLSAACEEAGVAFTAHPGVTVVPPGAVTPTSGDHFEVFTPYHRRWQEARWRPVVPAPERLRLPDGLDRGRVPSADDVCAGDRTSRLSAYLHFGCLSPREIVDRADGHDPAGEYVRRYVPELADAVDAAGGDVHEPWDLPAGLRRSLDYPDPIVDLDEARDRFLAARGKR